jgi:hypothetical protein
MRSSGRRPAGAAPALDQLVARQVAMAVALGLAQRVAQPGVQAARSVGRRAQRGSKRVGGREADAVELGEPVGSVRSVSMRPGP